MFSTPVLIIIMVVAVGLWVFMVIDENRRRNKIINRVKSRRIS